MIVVQCLVNSAISNNFSKTARLVRTCSKDSKTSFGMEILSPFRRGLRTENQVCKTVPCLSARGWKISTSGTPSSARTRKTSTGWASRIFSPYAMSLIQMFLSASSKLRIWIKPEPLPARLTPATPKQSRGSSARRMSYGSMRYRKSFRITPRDFGIKSHVLSLKQIGLIETVDKSPGLGLVGD